MVSIFQKSTNSKNTTDRYALDQTFVFRFTEKAQKSYMKSYRTELLD